VTDEGERRRRPQTIGGVVYVAVAGAVAFGLALVAVGAWDTGLLIMGGSLLAAAAARMVIPDVSAGMLKVRHKVIDVFTLTLLGASLIAAVIAVVRS
jgi:hypothetical protein